MACTCFSADKTVKCDHQRADDLLVIDLGDDSEKIHIDDTMIRELLAETATTRPTDAHLAAGQAKSRFYEDHYRRSREQDAQWAVLRELHRIVRPRPIGQRKLHDFGDTVPKELRYLVY